MFLRKLFSTENKAVWVLVDLLIVIIGVYCAFLIQNYAAQEKNKVEKERVLTALKYELEAFRLSFPSFSAFMKTEHAKYKQVYASGAYSNFSDWRYIEPQYSYQIIEYSMNLESSEVVNFKLYNVLQELYVGIKRLEYAERLMMEISMRYQSVPQSKQSSIEAAIVEAKNMDNFARFITFMSDRAGLLARVAEKSETALAVINSQLSSEKRKEIETNIIIENLERVGSEDKAVQQGMAAFPSFSEEEIRQLYQSNMK